MIFRNFIGIYKPYFAMENQDKKANLTPEQVGHDGEGPGMKRRSDDEAGTLPQARGDGGEAVGKGCEGFFSPEEPFSPASRGPWPG